MGPLSGHPWATVVVVMLATGAAYNITTTESNRDDLERAALWSGASLALAIVAFYAAKKG